MKRKNLKMKIREVVEKELSEFIFAQNDYITLQRLYDEMFGTNGQNRYRTNEVLKSLDKMGVPVYTASTLGLDYLYHGNTKIIVLNLDRFYNEINLNVHETK